MLTYFNFYYFRMQELFIIGIESQELCCIYEDLHWTILFTGITLKLGICK